MFSGSNPEMLTKMIRYKFYQKQNKIVVLKDYDWWEMVTDPVLLEQALLLKLTDQIGSEKDFYEDKFNLWDNFLIGRARNETRPKSKS